MELAGRRRIPLKLRRLYDEGYRIATEQTDALRAYLNK